MWSKQNQEEFIEIVLDDEDEQLHSTMQRKRPAETIQVDIKRVRRLHADPSMTKILMEDVLQLVLSFLNIKSLLRCMAVDKKMLAVVSKRSLWFPIVNTYFVDNGIFLPKPHLNLPQYCRAMLKLRAKQFLESSGMPSAYCDIVKTRNVSLFFDHKNLLLHTGVREVTNVIHMEITCYDDDNLLPAFIHLGVKFDSMKRRIKKTVRGIIDDLSTKGGKNKVSDEDVLSCFRIHLSRDSYSDWIWPNFECNLVELNKSFIDSDLETKNKSYYYSAGKYQNKYEEMFKTLIPEVGHANTSHGELLRAASHIYHRYFNDGDTLETSMKTLKPLLKGDKPFYRLDKQDETFLFNLCMNRSKGWKFSAGSSFKSKLFEPYLDIMMDKVIERISIN